MRVPITGDSVVDLDAPVLPAYEVIDDDGCRWVVWCQYCLVWHAHEPRDGHRSSPCYVPISAYRRCGYNVSLRGRWSDFFPGQRPEIEE